MAKKERNRRSARQARSRERTDRDAVAADVTEQEQPKSKSVKAEAKAKEPAKRKPNGILSRITGYFAGVRSEMHRVVWPSREELTNYTTGVICMLAVFGVACWLIDNGIVSILIAYSGLRG